MVGASTGTFWNLLEPSGTFWNLLEPSRRFDKFPDFFSQFFSRPALLASWPLRRPDPGEDTARMGAQPWARQTARSIAAGGGRKRKAAEAFLDVFSHAGKKRRWGSAGEASSTQRGLKRWRDFAGVDAGEAKRSRTSAGAFLTETFHTSLNGVAPGPLPNSTVESGGASTWKAYSRTPDHLALVPYHSCQERKSQAVASKCISYSISDRFRPKLVGKERCRSPDAIVVWNPAQRTLRLPSQSDSSTHQDLRESFGSSTSEYFDNEMTL